MSGGNIVIQLMLLTGIGLYLMGMVYISIKKPFYLGIIPPIIVMGIGGYFIYKIEPVNGKPGVRLEDLLLFFFGSLFLIGLLILLVIKVVLYIMNKIKVYGRSKKMTN